MCVLKGGASLAEGQLSGILQRRKRIQLCQISEPPVLLATAASSNRSDDTGLQNLVLSCVAYGEPLPQVEWQWRTDNSTTFPLREHSDNFSISTTTIETTIEDYDIVYLVSVLVVCDAHLDKLPAIQCSASNGLCEIDSVGYQTVQFTLDSDINIRLIKEVQQNKLYLMSQCSYSCIYKSIMIWF